MSALATQTLYFEPVVSPLDVTENFIGVPASPGWEILRHWCLEIVYTNAPAQSH
jgi:hypothetical protein